VNKEKLKVWDTSPKFAGVLSRMFNDSELQQIEKVYLNAVANGGAEELDFIREVGVSHNPRLARVGLIQLQEADILDCKLLLENISYSGDSKDDSATKNPSELVSLFHWLDRARHAHLAEKSVKALLIDQLVVESKRAVETAQLKAPKLLNKVELWCRRAEPELG